MENIQLSMFDIDVTPKGKATKNKVSFTKSLIQDSAPKIEKTKKPLGLTPGQQRFLDQNGVMETDNIETLSRIIKCSCGWMSIEGICKELNICSTTYINTEGQTEFILEQKALVLPKDKILYYKTDFEINTIQKQKLQGVKEQYQDKIKRIIHRHGDENILIELEDKLLDIIPKGWVLEFTETLHVDCTEDEVLEDFTVKKDLGKLVKAGAHVTAEINGRITDGMITREYGLGNSILNISFLREDGKKAQTAIGRFAIKAIK